MLYVGPGADSSPHAHHAVQVAISFAEPLRYRRARGRWRSGHVMALPADVEHEFGATAGPLALIYLEPDGASGRQMNGALVADADGAEARLAASLEGVGAPSGRDEALRFVELVAACLAGGAGPPPPRHPAVTKALTYVRGLELGAGIRERDIAPHVGLSPGRLSHLFAREVGVPFRPYVLWLRLEKAVGALAAGATLTEAAHAAGFADSAHLTRTCRRMFGTPPSAIASGVSFEGRPSFKGPLLGATAGGRGCGVGASPEKATSSSR
ncbi:MAG TPA: AraC family transcriptional regulator [Polyangiaceae bacterium]|nr:AraC family transcriptional regulator [Polyangiaceae bacterium]